MQTVYQKIELPPSFPLSVCHMSLKNDMQDRHFHNCFEISYITNGNARYEFENNSYDMHQGDLVMINNIEPHRVTNANANATQILLVFNPEFIMSSFNELDYEYLAPFICHGRDFSNLVSPTIATEAGHYIREILEEYNQKRDGFKLMIKAKLLCILTLIYRNSPKDRITSKNRRDLKHISVGLEYLESHFTDSIKLSQVAKLCGYTPPYFSSLFTLTMGVNFSNYLCSLRLNFSKQLLKNDNQSISDICEQSGYENMSNFIAQFKQKFGISPSQFRKQ